MSYELRFTERALSQLEALDRALRVLVLRHGVDLAINPTALSRKSVPPAELPGYQVYEFLEDVDGTTHRFVLLFRYGADEQTLFVHAVGHVEYG
mgnify:FL=1